MSAIYPNLRPQLWFCDITLWMYSFVWVKATEASQMSTFRTACVDLTCVCQKEGFRSSGLRLVGPCVCLFVRGGGLLVLLSLLAALTFTSIFHVCSFQTKAECWYNLLAGHRKWVFVCSLMMFRLLFLMRSSFFHWAHLIASLHFSMTTHPFISREKRAESFLITPSKIVSSDSAGNDSHVAVKMWPWILMEAIFITVQSNIANLYTVIHHHKHAQSKVSLLRETTPLQGNQKRWDICYEWMHICSI